MIKPPAVPPYKRCRCCGSTNFTDPVRYQFSYYVYYIRSCKDCGTQQEQEDEQ